MQRASDRRQSRSGNLPVRHGPAKRPVSATRARMLRLIGGVFGLVYVVVNAGSLPSTVAAALRVLAIAAFAGLVIATRRAVVEPKSDQSQGMAFSRPFWVVAAFESATIVGGWAVVSLALHAPHAVVAWVSVVVGVHFFALARVWRQSFYVWLGGAITACGVAGLVATMAGASDAAIAVVGGIVPGALLLAAGYRRVGHPSHAHVGSPVTRWGSRPPGGRRLHPAG